MFNVYLKSSKKIIHITKSHSCVTTLCGQRVESPDQFTETDNATTCPRCIDRGGTYSHGGANSVKHPSPPPISGAAFEDEFIEQHIADRMAE